MKRLVLGFFVFAFVFNTISLTAYASSCPKELISEQAKDGGGMPCHPKVYQSSKTSEKLSKPGHCKGICFCQHATLGQSTVPVRLLEALVVPVFAKNLIPAVGPQNFISIVSFPPERPPKQIS